MTNLFKTAIEAPLMGDFVLVVAAMIGLAICFFILYELINR